MVRSSERGGGIEISPIRIHKSSVLILLIKWIKVGLESSSSRKLGFFRKRKIIRVLEKEEYVEVAEKEEKRRKQGSTGRRERSLIQSKGGVPTL